MRDLAAVVDELPAPPPVAVRVLNIALDDELNAKEIAHLIESDQSLSIKALKAANAPVHGYASKVNSLEQAVVVLGLPALQHILLSIVIRESLLDTADLDDPLMVDLWRHSLACAVAAELVAERGLPDYKPLAFSAGMLHDCGKTLLLTLAPGSYEEAVEHAVRSGRPLMDEEERRMGVDHARAGGLLLEQWGLPAHLVNVARLHHLPASGLESLGDDGRIVAVVALGDLLAKGLHQTEEMQSRPADSRKPEREGLVDLLGLSPRDMGEIADLLPQRYAEREASFNLNPDSARYYRKALQRAKSRLADMGLELDAANKRLERANTLQEALTQAGLDMARADTIPAVFQAVLTALGRVAAGDGGVYRLDKAAGALHGLFWRGGREHVVSCAMDDTLLPCSSAHEAGVPEEYHDIFHALAERFRDEPPPPHTLATSGPFLLAPLLCDGELLGDIVLRTAEDSAEHPALPDAAPGRPFVFQLADAAAFSIRRLDLMRQRDERSDQLAKALRKLREMQLKTMQTERLAAVGQLAAGAAHEINNPLAIIYARAQLLEQSEPDEKRGKSIRQMKQQIERISDILKNLMAFARPDPPSFTSLDINAVVERSISLLRTSIGTLPITITSRTGAAVPRLQGDPRQLEQVLLNIGINALHAMEKKGGELTVATSYDAARNVVRIAVRDQGPGVQPEILTKIFDPFFTTKAEGKGTGLGLSTSYGIIQNHNGSLAARNHPEGGAVFTITLPVPREHDAPQPRPQEPAPAADQTKTSLPLLVVDDEKHIREILKESLEAAGYTVNIARDGRNALAKLEKRRYGCLLLDIRMPQKSGLSLLKDLAARDIRLPVIVLTGLAGPEEIAEAKRLGAAACLQKPFAIETLLKTVRHTLTTP